ncbi:PP149 [Orf virus]|uniref:PP149 n=1 Tax=Orf virus TaxID=10258 RepID=F1AWW5_ORFV|nr:PP149 [Orf virus]
MRSSAKAFMVSEQSTECRNPSSVRRTSWTPRICASISTASAGVAAASPEFTGGILCSASMRLRKQRSSGRVVYSAEAISGRASTMSSIISSVNAALMLCTLRAFTCRRMSPTLSGNRSSMSRTSSSVMFM